MSNLRNNLSYVVFIYSPVTRLYVTVSNLRVKSLLNNRGPLKGGPQCGLSILRNDNVPCHYFSNVPVDFKVV